MALLTSRAFAGGRVTVARAEARACDKSNLHSAKRIGEYSQPRSVWAAPAGCTLCEEAKVLTIVLNHPRDEWFDGRLRCSIAYRLDRIRCLPTARGGRDIRGRGPCSVRHRARASSRAVKHHGARRPVAGLFVKQICEAIIQYKEHCGARVSHT